MPNPFRTPLGQRLRQMGAGEMAMSALLHGVLAYVLCTAMAALDASEREGITVDDVSTMRSYLRAAAEREGGGEGALEALSKAGGEGLSDGRPGLADGPIPSVVPQPRGARVFRPEERGTTRAGLLREAESFGVIGLLAARAGSIGAGATSRDVWSDAAMGESAIGAAWGEALDGQGAGGLLLSGAGEGGGYSGEGIGLGAIGTLGRCGSHASRCGSGVGQGFGRIGGRLPGAAHQVRSASICHGPANAPLAGCAATSVIGRLPPEVIQRIVRQNHGRFRLCYESGLKSDPGLSGRVETKFVIGRDGAVAMASVGASDLTEEVNACVARAFAALSFPQPEGGIVTVVYPLVFSFE